MVGLLLSAVQTGDNDRQRRPLDDQQQWRRSTALSSKCEQCHVDSWRRKLNTDLFKVLFAVFLQILSPSPLPGLVLSPVCGVVPVGGVTLISATLTPNAVMKFDSQVNIAVRNGKSVEIRVSGSVEPPLVDIDLVYAAVLCLIQVLWLFSSPFILR